MKDFLLLANNNAITYKEFNPFIKEGIVRSGYRQFNKDFCFDLGEEAKEQIVREKKEGSGWKIVDGEICGRVANACWFTTLPIQRDLILALTKTYNETDYPKYDNYDAIEVSRVKNIPKDYYGVMGVPITFLSKHNPNQFELVKFGYGDDNKYLRIDGKTPYYRILIRRKQI